MPYRVFDTTEVGRYLHLTPADVEQLVRNREIPFEKRGNRLVFRKVDIDVWASRRILGLEGKSLARFHAQTSTAVAGFLEEVSLMPELLHARFMEPNLPAKTKASALREMVALASRTGRVADPKALLESVQSREELCSTGLPGGLALLHSRHPDPAVIESPFIVVGRSVQPIPFGAPDHGPTELFFLLGCPDDRLHLHTLARICLMAQKTELLSRLRVAASSEEMHEEILQAEKAVLGSRGERENR